MSYPLTSIVASRTLYWKKGHHRYIIEVQIGQPLPRVNLDTNMKDWYCSFTVLGVGDDSVQTVIGQDAFQALLTAMQMSGVIVSNSAPARAKLLEDAQLPNFGFPSI